MAFERLRKASRFSMLATAWSRLPTILFGLAIASLRMCRVKLKSQSPKVLVQPGFVAIRTNVSTAHYWTIARGAGIGMLPTYTYVMGAQALPIDIGLQVP